MPASRLFASDSMHVAQCQFWPDSQQRIQVLEQDEEDTATQEAYQSLLQLRNQIFEDPSQDLNDWAKRLRQANFKQTWRLRHC